MDKVSICHSCGRTIDSAFPYCPWCGAAAEAVSPLTEQFDEVFGRIEAMQTRHTQTRIGRMETELGEIERELSLMLSGSHTA